MKLRVLGSVLAAITFFTLSLTFVVQTYAQSCSDYYFRQTVSRATCPSSKACNVGCSFTTVTDTVSCWYTGSACMGNIQPGSDYCTYGACNSVEYTRSCTIDINAVGIVPICSACPYGAWTNQGCGAGGCVGTQMYQSRSSSTATSVCETQYRCVADSSCGSSCSTSVGRDSACGGTTCCNSPYVCHVSGCGVTVCSVSGCATEGTSGCSSTLGCCAGLTPNIFGVCLGTGTPTPTPTLTPTNTPTPTPFVFLPTPTRTPTPTPIVIPPTLTPTPTLIAFPYYKVKDASFYKLGNLSSPIALGSSTVYDSSDTAANVFNQGASGIVAAQGTINVGTGTVSSSGWSKASQSIPSSFTAASFKDYVVTRKAVTTITSLAQITASGIYYYNGDLTIASDIAVDNVVLVVNGNVTLVGIGGATKTFNTAIPRSFALVVAGTPASPKTLTFADTLTEAHGVFVADDIQFSANEFFPSSTPLKIVGNVSSSSGVSVMRERGSNKTAASLFIVFDPTVYVNLFDKLSIVKSSWTQIQ